MAIPKPCRAVVLMPRSRDDAKALLRRGRAWSHETHGDSRALSCRVTGLVPRGTWRHWSPLLAGGVLDASEHVVTPEPSPGGWSPLCHGARGRARALWHRERVLSRGDTWRHQSPLMPGAESGAAGLVFEVLYTWVPDLQGTNSPVRSHNQA
jgi:hypothetical protein